LKLLPLMNRTKMAPAAFLLEGFQPRDRRLRDDRQRDALLDIRHFSVPWR